MIDALADGRIDVGPLDSFSHDLIERYDPARAAQVRTVASTVMRPIPPLVATAPIAPDALARLREALVGTHRASELAETMARLQLAGFAVVGTRRLRRAPCRRRSLCLASRTSE